MCMMERNKGKGGRFVLRLVVRTSPLRRSGVDHTVLSVSYTPHLPLPVVRQRAPRLNEQLQHQLMKLTAH